MYNLKLARQKMDYVSSYQS